jgi:hypothetical protein
LICNLDALIRNKFISVMPVFPKTESNLYLILHSSDDRFLG